MHGGTLPAPPVGEIDEDQRVVDHHAGEGHDAEQADQAQAVSQQQVTDHGADNAEGNAHHDNQGLAVALERHGQEGIDEQLGNHEPGHQSAHALLAIRLASLEGVGEP